MTNAPSILPLPVGRSTGIAGQFGGNFLLCPACPVKIKSTAFVSALAAVFRSDEWVVPSIPRSHARRFADAVGAYRSGFVEMEKLLMRWPTLGYRMVFLLVAIAVTASGHFASEALGQNNQQNTGVAGVVIDGQGVLRRQLIADPGGLVTRQRIAAVKASMPPKLTRSSKLRKVSLTLLEKAIRDQGGVPNDVMRYLAGLQRVRYVFCYPETGDVVLAGPAEGWITDVAGRVVGMTSGRPVVQLQDLVVALRAFPPQGQGTPVIGCSIDPTQQGLAEMQRFLRASGSSFTAGQEQAFAAYVVNGSRTSLGMQEISVNGVPADTHFAQVLVEADYRMKLIGIGLERPPVRMVSFVDRVNPAAVSRNALFRWYFVPDYNCVRQSEDGLGMELVGDGVRLVGEDELVAAGGQRRVVSGSRGASQMFTTSFTKKYAELAAYSPVYAELRNLIDLVVAAAYIQERDYYGKAGWTMELFGSEEGFAVRTYAAPKQVESTVAAVWKGRRLMTPIGGGVQIEPAMALKPESLLQDEQGKVAELREETTLELPEGQWWWD